MCAKTTEESHRLELKGKTATLNSRHHMTSGLKTIIYFTRMNSPDSRSIQPNHAKYQDYQWSH